MGIDPRTLPEHVQRAIAAGQRLHRASGRLPGLPGRLPRPRRPKGGQTPHVALLAACVDLLRLRGCLSVKVFSGTAWAPNGRGGYRPVKGAEGGTVDLIAALPHAVTLWCELKCGDDRLSETQRQFRDDLMMREHYYLELHDTVDDLMRFLDEREAEWRKAQKVGLAEMRSDGKCSS